MLTSQAHAHRIECEFGGCSPFTFQDRPECMEVIIHTPSHTSPPTSRRNSALSASSAEVKSSDQNARRAEERTGSEAGLQDPTRKDSEGGRGVRRWERRRSDSAAVSKEKKKLYTIDARYFWRNMIQHDSTLFHLALGKDLVSTGRCKHPSHPPLR